MPDFIMKIYIHLIFSAILLLSCSDLKEEAPTISSELKKDNQVESSVGLDLLKKHCYSCHSPESSSHDEIIAPPMAAVKMRYSMSYKSEQEFVNAIVAWTMDPKQENALMRGAIDRFKVMPKQLFDENQMRQLALFMYRNDLSEPIWFEAHQKEMHGKGGKRRQGMP